MRKILSLLMAAITSIGMFAEGTATTVYYTAGADVIGTYSVKLNVHMGCNGGDDWKQYDMVKTDKKYGGDAIYKAEFTDYRNGLCALQFQLYDGSTWKSQAEVFNGSWLSESAYNGKMYVHSLGEWVAADAQPGDALPAPDVVLKGSFDSWGAGYKFTPSDDKKTATLTRNITADSYAFKLTVGGAWYGEEGTKVTRENCTDIPFTANTGDAILTADADGDYTFVYTFETKKLSVTFPPAPENPLPVINYYMVGSFNEWKLETCEPMAGDSIVYQFAAGMTELKVLPQKTGWDNAMGYSKVNAECSSAGISGNDGDNIIFTLKEAGEVKIKVVDGKLCITGAFVVPEPQPVVNYYMVGSFNEWKLETCEPMAGDSIVYQFAAGMTELKVLPQKTGWDNAMGYSKVNAECSSAGISGNDGDNIIFTLKEAGDVKIKVVDGKLCITGPFYVPAQPTMANGFYLIGQKGWDLAALSAELLFAASPDNNTEYVLNVTLAENDELKVVKVENDAIKAWYPDGMDNQYKVDAAHAGAKSVYFRETYNEDWAAFGGYIYIEANTTTGVVDMVNGTEAVKFIRDGQLYIRANGIVYTVMGQIVAKTN